MDIEIRVRWFNRHRPVLVTREMLFDQIGVHQLRHEDFSFQGCIGNGAFGIVSKVMERRSGLMMAVKEQRIHSYDDKSMVRRELKHMINLRHVSESFNVRSSA